jgi:hypothetical protein
MRCYPRPQARPQADRGILNRCQTHLVAHPTHEPAVSHKATFYQAPAIAESDLHEPRTRISNVSWLARNVASASPAVELLSKDVDVYLRDEWLRVL